jgi:hypothetical protein
LLHGKTPAEQWVRAMHTSLILYAEHEFVPLDKRPLVKMLRNIAPFVTASFPPARD